MYASGEWGRAVGKNMRLPLKFTWSEAEMEDFLAENISRLNFGFGPLELVKRQAKIGSAGIADIIAYDARNLYVIELKRDVADESAVAQTMRYAGALQSRVRGIIHGSNLDEDFCCVATEHGTRRIKACLIAQEFTDGALHMFSFLETADPDFFRLYEWGFESYAPGDDEHGLAIGRLYPMKWGPPYIDVSLSGDAESYSGVAAKEGITYAREVVFREDDEQCDHEPDPKTSPSQEAGV